MIANLPISEETEPQAQVRDLSVVIPAYNEADRIAATIRVTVEELTRLGCSFELVVVDDGSRDGTHREAEVAASRETMSERGLVRVVTYARNGGKGCAVKYGAALTTGRFVAFLDADLELHPRLLSRMLAIQASANCDIVIGSKRHPESIIDYPNERKLYSTVYYHLCRLLFGLPIRDTQTGIKLVRGTFARDVLPYLRVNRYAYDLEMLAIAHGMGLSIVEAPIELTFSRPFGRIGPTDIRAICMDTAAIWWHLRFSSNATSVTSRRMVGSPGAGTAVTVREGQR